MSATRTDAEGRRVSVQLDPGILVESLILQRLNTVPKRRHQDWIRALLVQGFLAESGMIRRLNATATQNRAAQRREPQSPRSGFDFSDWVGRCATPKPMVKVTPGITQAVPEGTTKQG
ncbi:MAG: hypothetical protein WBM63_09400, partial [Sedimenticolaceae bacterium]